MESKGFFTVHVYEVSAMAKQFKLNNFRYFVNTRYWELEQLHNTIYHIWDYNN